jgi:DNA-directed RNA polymerase subunit RPC12/RpoP
MRKKVCDGTHSQSDIPPIYHVLANHGHTATTSKKQKETYVCGKCKKAFSYARHLEKHLQGHKRNDCKDCSEMFASRKYLNLHMREKHDKKLLDTKYSCKFCKQVFTRSCFLYTHYRVHAEGRLVCEICGDFCTDTNEYEKHLLKHEESRLSCILCHRTFARQQQYSMHMQVIKNFISHFGHYVSYMLWQP